MIKKNMTKNLILSLVLVFNSFINAQTIKVAILDFENTSGIAKYDGLGKAMSSMLITDIEANVSPKRLQLVERSQIQKILKEQNFQATSAVDKTSSVKAGKLLGVKYLLVGDIYILNDVLVINARLTDTETGDIKFSKKQEGKLVGWLNLKTNIAKELAASIAMPFNEPNIPDKEINMATITSFGNAITAKDEGKIEKAEELVNTIKEFSPDFKYLDDLKSQLDELKKQVEKNTADIEVLDKSGGRIINAKNYEELLINLSNPLTSKSEQIEYVNNIITNYPIESEKNMSSISSFPLFEIRGFTEESFLNDMYQIKKRYESGANKKIFTKYIIKRLLNQSFTIIVEYYRNESKNISIEKRMPKINSVIALLRELLYSLDLNELEKNKLGLQINYNLMEAFVPLKMHVEINNFKTLLSINSFNLIDKEIKYYTSKLINENSFMNSIFPLIETYPQYRGYIELIIEYTGSGIKNDMRFMNFSDPFKKIFRNKYDSIGEFFIIKFPDCSAVTNEDKEIINNIFVIENNQIKISIDKFQKQYKLSVNESQFFQHFIKDFNTSFHDDIINNSKSGEQLINCGLIDYFLLFNNKVTKKYDIVCFYGL